MSNKRLDRYFETDSGWGMVHLGCLENAPREKRDDVFSDAIKGGSSGNDVVLEAPQNIDFPAVACSLCNTMGKLKEVNNG